MKDVNFKIKCNTLSESNDQNWFFLKQFSKPTFTMEPEPPTDSSRHPRGSHKHYHDRASKTDEKP